MAATTKKKKRKEEAYPWKAGICSRHITDLKQSILEPFDIYGYVLLYYLDVYGWYSNHCLHFLSMLFLWCRWKISLAGFFDLMRYDFFSGQSKIWRGLSGEAQISTRKQKNRDTAR
jgi:hypothetical protein